MLVVIAAWHGQLVAAHMLMPAHVDELALGGYLAVHDPERRRRFASGVQPPAGLALVTLLGAGNFVPPPAQPLVLMVVMMAAVALFLATAIADAVTAPLSFFGRIGSVEWLRKVGGYAYGLYLLQCPVQWALERVRWDVRGIVSRFGMSNPGAVAIYATVAFALTWAAARVSWALLEKPCNDLKRFFAYSVRDQGVPNAVAVDAA